MLSRLKDDRPMSRQQFEECRAPPGRRRAKLTKRQHWVAALSMQGVFQQLMAAMTRLRAVALFCCAFWERSWTCPWERANTALARLCRVSLLEAGLAFHPQPRVLEPVGHEERPFNPSDLARR